MKNICQVLKQLKNNTFCDIEFVIKDNHIAILTAEDNLLKGPAAQAIKCFNIRLCFSEIESII